MYFNSIIKKLQNNKEITSIALGGSRSRNDWKEKSDFDIFCVITTQNFDEFKNNFAEYLESIEEINCAAELFYLENWGYLFKAIDTSGMLYDITIIPKCRISEMSVRTTNIVLKDTNDYYQSEINSADDERYCIEKLEYNRYKDYVKLFSFEFNRFLKAADNKDYWYIIRCLERMKNYYIRCDRIQKKIYPKSRSCPEKFYSEISNDLDPVYILDGTIETAIKTGHNLFNAYYNMIKDKNLLQKCNILWKTN